MKREELKKKKKYTNYTIIAVHKEETTKEMFSVVHIIYISISLILTHIISLLLEILITQW